MKFKISFFVFFTIALSLFSLGVPPLNSAINDYASLLNTAEKEELEGVLRKLDKETKIQIALLTIPSLKGETLEDFSIKVVEKWKLGDSDASSGALLLIAKEEKKIRIEVGYGLEKDLTDATCSSIIRSKIKPAFKDRDYYKGIKDGLFAMIAYAKKDESLIKEIEENYGKEDSGGYGAMIISIIVYIFLAKRFKGNVFWPLFLFANLFGYNSRYSKRRRGRGSFFEPYINSYNYGDNSEDNNSSNSPFSGKGGSFGGGGASGGW